MKWKKGLSVLLAAGLVLGQAAAPILQAESSEFTIEAFTASAASYESDVSVNILPVSGYAVTEEDNRNVIHAHCGDEITLGVYISTKKPLDGIQLILDSSSVMYLNWGDNWNGKVLVNDLYANHPDDLGNEYISAVWSNSEPQMDLPVMTFTISVPVVLNASDGDEVFFDIGDGSYTVLTNDGTLTRTTVFIGDYDDVFTYEFKTLRIGARDHDPEETTSPVEGSDTGKTSDITDTTDTTDTTKTTSSKDEVTVHDKKVENVARYLKAYKEKMDSYIDALSQTAKKDKEELDVTNENYLALMETDIGTEKENRMLTFEPGTPVEAQKDAYEVLYEFMRKGIDAVDQKHPFKLDIDTSKSMTEIEANIINEIYDSAKETCKDPDKGEGANRYTVDLNVFGGIFKQAVGNGTIKKGKESYSVVYCSKKDVVAKTMNLYLDDLCDAVSSQYKNATLAMWDYFLDKSTIQSIVSEQMESKLKDFGGKLSEMG